MKNMKISIKEKGRPEKMTVKLENADSSNEETEEEAEDGQQNREDVDSMGAEVHEPEGKHQREVQKNYSEEEIRIMRELRRLAPDELADEVAHLEEELYELGQREAREITRSKHLDSAGKNKRRSSK